MTADAISNGQRFANQQEQTSSNGSTQNYLLVVWRSY